MIVLVYSVTMVLSYKLRVKTYNLKCSNYLMHNNVISSANVQKISTC